MVIHRLEIENFASIRDRQVIDLRVMGRHPDELSRAAPVWRGANEFAPKVVTLFGANASGKSNVLRALSFLVWFIKDSFSSSPGARLPFERFNDEEALNSPTRLVVHLGGLADISDINNPHARECRYVYELTISGNLDHPVITETLLYWPHGRKVTLFERRSDNTVSASKAFNLTKHREAIGAILRPNASAISTLSQINHDYSKYIWNFAAATERNILFNRMDPSDDGAIRYYFENPVYIDRLNQDISRMDIGIEKVDIAIVAGKPEAIFTHRGLFAPMRFDYESHGTRQFFKLYPSLIFVLDRGGVAVVDELDAAIHPIVLPEILRWFHDPERNPHDAQLWMTCHNASLLEHLTPSEVLFCEKDSFGKTEIYGLSDIERVSADESIYRKYIGGMFGAIPQIG
ncbi:AAA family ATPase [Methylobacterium aquaticum]|uniref:AAA family ATPase n=1 Tax=Methylobacterium aquaticum TaxID=270351 RepID=UPI0019343308|nr:ATP-binding protein [Methylobacterium aquaticum]QRE76455.1 AAA family ATPase [Methylobacterium aquaticum]